MAAGTPAPNAIGTGTDSLGRTVIFFDNNTYTVITGAYAPPAATPPAATPTPAPTAAPTTPTRVVRVKNLTGTIMKWFTRFLAIAMVLVIIALGALFAVGGEIIFVLP